MLACLKPNLARSVHTASPKAVHKVSGRFNVLTRRFGAYLVGMKHLSKTPLFSTYKRRPPISS